MSQGPQETGFLRRLLIAGALWLLFFSFLFTLGEEFQIWPRLRPGALRGTDFAAGVAAGGAILLTLLLSRKRRR